MSLGPVLSVESYTLDYRTRGGPFRALDDVTLSIGRGEVLGLVGESGSGKTSLAAAIMRALPASAREPSGSIKLSGTELIGLAPRAIRAVRGKRIGMVFQDPSAALNPTMTLGSQMAEALTTHMGLSDRDARAEGERLFARVGLADPAAMMRRYPHEASGGEKQRVVIATAFACKPELMLFDEPTTALDVVIARQILDLFLELQAETGVASLYISHDLAVVSKIASRVAVIHQGRIVERGEVPGLFAGPKDAYTRALIDAVPRPGRRLVADAPAAAAPLAQARGLTVTYGRPSLFDRRPLVAAARDVSFDIAPGEILGVVGESGSGKSTIARALTGLAPFTGELTLGGRAIAGLADMDAAYRRDVQIVFQHPDASLNPRQRVRDILARPFALYGRPQDRTLDAAIADLLEGVKLTKAHADRYPHELSGGQKQRVAIARAFASRPKLVICDEVTSSLDVSVQAAVIELLIELRRQTGAAYLFITHDITLVREIAHRILVMYRGDLVETVEAGVLAAKGPSHPYTARLIEAVPTITT